MLELRTYTKAELVEIFGTKDKQGLTRKLQRYGIKYQTAGRGENLTFTITETADPFKVFCIDELGYDGRTDFVKLRNFLYCFLNDDEFRAMPDEVKEQRMKESGKPMCRQTIAGYIAKLDAQNLIDRNSGEYIYYFAYKDTQRIATRQEYSEAWKEYWEAKAAGANSMEAIGFMRFLHGGVARKQAIPQINGIFLEKLNRLNAAVCQSIENELG
jgi:hypothetical protein